MSAESLPRFARPPVVETLMGVCFRPLDAFSSAHQGWFWGATLRSEFPQVEERDPLDEVRELLEDESIVQLSSGHWRASGRPEAVRLWAASAAGDRVVQVQRNALIMNWLKPRRDTSWQDPDYLRYPTRTQQFSEMLGRLSAFTDEKACGKIQPSSCFLTYVNHVELSKLCEAAPTAAKVFCFWTPPTDGGLPSADSVQFEVSYPLPERLGRFRIVTSTAVRSEDGRPILRFDVLVRGSPKQASLDRLLDWFDAAHAFAVRGFLAATRVEVHAEWGIIP